MDVYNDVSYIAVPRDEECVLNAVQIGKLIDEPPTTIRDWANNYANHLYIKKINGRFTYTEASVDQFKIIKILVRDKGFSHKQIKEHIERCGFKYSKNDSGLISPENQLPFQAVAESLALENKKQFENFLIQFVQKQQETQNEFFERMKIENAITIQETIESELQKHIESIQDELKNTQEMIKKETKLHESMLKTHENFEKEQENHRGLIYKLKHIFK
jgi:vacuolar-type H+-ATPase subunit I/STV1